MAWESIDWPALERLRAVFLEGAGGAADYWQNRGDLASYDRTFAQRIGWKWDYVLAELDRAGWQPPEGELLDWGCGSGIAGRAFLNHYGVNSGQVLSLHDRSLLAVDYARERARAKYPGLEVRRVGTGTEPAILLISHVLTEMREEQRAELLALAGRARSVIWVEPGNFAASRALISMREALRGPFQIVAPCCHQGGCGLLAPENAPHWCHHFATPPPEVFTDGDWVRFGQLAGVDLRSLPVSYLVLDRRSAPALPPGAFRLLGRPRIYKPNASLLGCDAEGVRELKVARRHLPEAWRRLKKGDYSSLLCGRVAGGELCELSFE